MTSPTNCWCGRASSTVQFHSPVLARRTGGVRRRRHTFMSPTAVRNLISLAIGVSLLVGCQRAPQEVPKVIGIPFAVPVASIKQHLPDPAKPEQYPLIPMYGYKLRYANPENWEVIVQDESPDELNEPRILPSISARTLGARVAEAMHHQ